MSGGSVDGTERPETVEIDRQKVTTMLHQLTLTRERERLSPVSDEHLDTATTWLEELLDMVTDRPEGGGPPVSNGLRPRLLAAAEAYEAGDLERADEELVAALGAVRKSKGGEHGDG